MNSIALVTVSGLISLTGQELAGGQYGGHPGGSLRSSGGFCQDSLQKKIFDPGKISAVGSKKRPTSRHIGKSGIRPSAGWRGSYTMQRVPDGLWSMAVEVAVA